MRRWLKREETCWWEDLELPTTAKKERAEGVPEGQMGNFSRVREYNVPEGEGRSGGARSCILVLFSYCLHASDRHVSRDGIT